MSEPLTPEERASALVSRFESSTICTEEAMARCIADAIRAAEERGAERMRERAAHECTRTVIVGGVFTIYEERARHWAEIWDAIRALPLKEPTT